MKSKKQYYYDTLTIKKDEKIVSCLMTWDSKEMCEDLTDDIFPFCLSKDELMHLEDTLKINKQVLVIKLHPMYKNISQINKVKDLSHIRVLQNDAFTKLHMETYELLSLSSLLITDYSSVFIDYYLTEKPVIFYKNEFMNNKRKIELIENYQDYMAGPIVNNVDELIYWLGKTKDNDYSYYKKIKELKGLWFIDNSKTVYEDIIKFLDSRVN